VRAAPTGAHEFDVFTDAFNQMLVRIQLSEGKLHAQLGRLSLLQHITRATGDRQDLHSIFLVVLASLEENLPIDFGCMLLHDPVAQALTVSTLGVGSAAYAGKLNLPEGLNVPIDQNGLSRCVGGQLVYEPDVLQVPYPFPQRLAVAGLRSLVIAPLSVESKVFGVLVCARRAEQAFSSAECEFLKQLSEHVALASHQTQLGRCSRRTTTSISRNTPSCSRSGCGPLGKWPAVLRMTSTMPCPRFPCTRSPCLNTNPILAKGGAAIWPLSSLPSRMSRAPSRACASSTGSARHSSRSSVSI
jgi:hypothetical protein